MPPGRAEARSAVWGECDWGAGQCQGVVSGGSPPALYARPGPARKDLPSPGHWRPPFRRHRHRLQPCVCALVA